MQRCTNAVYFAGRVCSLLAWRGKIQCFSASFVHWNTCNMPSCHSRILAFVCSIFSSYNQPLPVPVFHHLHKARVRRLAFITACFCALCRTIALSHCADGSHIDPLFLSCSPRLALSGQRQVGRPVQGQGAKPDASPEIDWGVWVVLHLLRIAHSIGRPQEPHFALGTVPLLWGFFFTSILSATGSPWLSLALFGSDSFSHAPLSEYGHNHLHPSPTLFLHSGGCSEWRGSSDCFVTCISSLLMFDDVSFFSYSYLNCALLEPRFYLYFCLHPSVASDASFRLSYSRRHAA